MGFLEDKGKVLTFEQSLKYQEYLKREAVVQFQKIYDQFVMQNISCKELLWGDEIEHQIVNFDHKNKRVKLQCNTQYILQEINNINEKEFDVLDKEQQKLVKNQFFKTIIEYGGFMIETIPLTPYCCLCHMSKIRENLRTRYQRFKQVLKNGDVAMNITAFPLLGVENSFIDNNEYLIDENDSQEIQEIKRKVLWNEYGQSNKFPDSLITNHNRFRYLSQNIRERRKSKVQILQRVFKDKNTKLEWVEGDHMGMGMGMGCIQQTFSTININNCRLIYDQLSILSPIMIAFTAATPIFNGYLIDNDSRWNIISQSVDCRTKDESDNLSINYIPKSRYSSISYFISNSPLFKNEYNDIKFKINKQPVLKPRKNSIESGVNLDPQLQDHLAYLLSRDSLVVFQNDIDQVSENSDIFESFNSTNWNNVRFKPHPSLNSENMGWRVEFRSMELQPTETENTFSLFLVKLIAQIFSCNDSTLCINFYIPISYVDLNFERAVKKNALLEQKFYFRTNIHEQGFPIIQELTIKEYFCGNESFQGLLSVLQLFYNQVLQKKCKQIFDIELFYQEFKQLINYVKCKVSGEYPTTASFIRNFVMNHKEYKQDSIVNDRITYDLLITLDQITNDDNYSYQ